MTRSSARALARYRMKHHPSPPAHYHTLPQYLWMLKQPVLWEGVATLRPLSLAVLALSMLQLVVFTIVFCMPALIAITGYMSIS